MINKTLCITIDPGYDSYKIAINNDWFSFSSKMLKVDDSIYATMGRPAGSVYVRTEGHEFIIGNAVEKHMTNSDLIKDNVNLLDSFASTSRFKDSNFRYSIQGAMAYALWQYENSPYNKEGFSIEKIEEYSVYVAVALPHDMINDNWEIIRSYLVCKHDISIYIRDINKEIHCNYDLSKAKAVKNSQVICAYLYQATDDDCSNTADSSDLLPAIIIDGGYKTFGRFYLDEGYSMAKGGSDTSYAMYNIDKGVSDKVNKLLPNRNFRAYQVKNYASRNQILTSGKDKVNVKEIYDAEVKEVSKNAYLGVQELMGQLMDDARCIIMAGGTGAIYYPYFAEYAEEDYGDNLKVILPNKKYLNRDVDQKFVICLGLHKYALSLIDEG